MMSESFKLFTRWMVFITFALIAIGGIVRTTGSGLGCPDWPLCYGNPIPPYDIHALIEFSHRATTTLVSVSVLWATLRYRHEKVIFYGAWLGLVLLALQIALGGIVVLFELPPALVSIHLANALLIFATMVVISVEAHRPWPTVAAHSNPRLRRLIALSAIAVYILIFSGSVVTNTNAMAACLGWPLCNGDLLPKTVFQAINLTHRYFAAAVGVLLFYVLSETLRRQRANRALRRAAHTAVGLFGAQIIVGGINVLALFHPAWNALHLAVATAAWGAMVAFAMIGWQTLGGQASEGRQLSVVGEQRLGEIGD